MRIARIAVLLSIVLGFPAVGSASHPDRQLMCPAPISTCDDADAVPCPPWYDCTCVPSCIDCRDCAAKVCVATTQIACHSQCDCEPGLACIGAYCQPGQPSAYCCESDRCPDGEPCQHQNGSPGQCGSNAECQTACDCSVGLACVDGQCVAGIVPVYCCDADPCPAGQQCQHRDGSMDQCSAAPECRTACDCSPGLGCFDGKCIAGFAPVFCCEGDQCPAGEQCQYKDGRMDRCGAACVDQIWRCDTPGGDGQCEEGRVCSCSASCPGCEDCGPAVCVPPGAATPYRCNTDGSCARPGDRCACVSSCAACDNCELGLCVPSCGTNAMCDRRRQAASRKIEKAVEHFRHCQQASDCVRVDTGTACGATCGAWVNQRPASRLREFIGRIDQRYCDQYQKDGCTFVTPRCVNQVPACLNGRCTGLAPPQ